MTELPSTRLQELAPGALLEELSVLMYEAPLSALSGSPQDLPEPLRVPLLILAFDTELNINGILGFLENSTGAYLPDTILAFSSIGATSTASTLMRIDTLVQAHGFTAAHLRQDLSSREQFQVTTFLASHGESSAPMASAVGAEARNLYLYQEHGESVFLLLEAFIEKHRRALIEALISRGV